jgi:hypothetical protein
MNNVAFMAVPFIRSLDPCRWPVSVFGARTGTWPQKPVVWEKTENG